MTDRPRALTVLIAVFLLGGILGAGGTYWWMERLSASGRAASQDHRPGRGPGRQQMQEILGLTKSQELEFGKIMAESRKQIEDLRAQQRPQLDAIFAEQQPKIDAIFAEQQPKVDEILADTNRKVMAILNEDQQKKFQSMWKEMNSRGRRGGRGGRGMEPPPPPSR
jgi:Spy/CpxP family protein refolding chaperone